MKIIKKLTWIIKRHPYLYYIRFKLLSRNGSVNQVEAYSYNAINKKQALPNNFNEVNLEIFKNFSKTSDLDKTIQLSKWLRLHIKGGSGLSLSSAKALDKMLKGEGGVCSDVSQVFNNFCVLNDIEVKEWGLTSFPYDIEFGGHAFNEVYVKELKKWVLIDVSKTVLFYKDGYSEPLSVLEVFELNKSSEKIYYKSFFESNDIESDLINDYFLNPKRVPFLICNYNNQTYDKYLDRYQGVLPIFMIHFWLYITRRSYYYLFPLHDSKSNFSYNR